VVWGRAGMLKAVAVMAEMMESGERMEHLL
jgi:hypothetical protein